MTNYNRNDRQDFRKRRSVRREMYKAVCAECGKECEIPFEPKDGRPVYCSECFEKKDTGSQGQRNFRDNRGSERRPRFERREEKTQNNEQLESISQKLDKIIEILSAPALEPVKKPIKSSPAPKKKAKITKKK